MDLLSKTYDEAVVVLLQKNGPVQDDYFREKSYQRFMNGEIKNITKGKFARAIEGLYCHHIDENIELNISDQLFIKKYNIPFAYQRKERLVYCDLVEHSILHVLIAKETSMKFGLPGYEAYLKQSIEAWYIDGIIPTREWEKNCYNRSFLNPEEAFALLKEMQKILELNYFSSLLDYYNDKKRQEEDRIERERACAESLKDNRKRLIRSARLLHSKSPRKEIVEKLYRLKYEDTTVMIPDPRVYKEFDSNMKQYTKEKLLDELNTYLDDLEEIE